ncbi:MAG: TetR/AcrR family transcriptional regulator [bacterium]|nr:TetR/AcrR family transcriptional regulator [bacterium]
MNEMVTEPKKSKTVREPKQRRGIEMKRRIMDNARSLFSEKGIYGTTSNEIAAVAGVSIGSFYSYFPDKHTLFLAVLEDFISSMTDNASNIELLTSVDLEKIDLKDIIRTFVTITFKSFDSDPAFHKQTIGLRFLDPDVNEIYIRAEKKELDLIELLFKRYAETRPLPVMDIKVAAKIIHGMTAYAIYSVKFLDYPSDQDQLINELTLCIVSYVTSGEIKQPSIIPGTPAADEN